VSLSLISYLATNLPSLYASTCNSVTSGRCYCFSNHVSFPSTPEPLFSASLRLASDVFPAEVLIPALHAGTPRLRHHQFLPLAFFFSNASTGINLTMARLVRSFRKIIDSRLRHGPSPSQTRTYLTQSQRRKTTTASFPKLRFPLIDHHYEYETR
jgi:hypothetical protein